MTEVAASRDPADTAPGTLIRARRLTRVYRRGDTAIEALRGVDLDVGSGELLMILGLLPSWPGLPPRRARADSPASR